MSTGFLFGSDPMLAPDGDASRISTNIPSYEYPLSDYFAPVQTGILYEGAVATLEGGSSSYFVPEAQTPLYLLGGAGLLGLAGCLLLLGLTNWRSSR